MNSRLDRWFPLLLFAAITCGVAIAIFFTTAPWFVKGAVFIFPLAGFGAIVHLIWGEIDCLRVGELTLRVSGEASAGSVIKVGLRVKKPQLAERIATFTLVSECYSEINDSSLWREVWSTTSAAAIARGSLTAETSLELPRAAQPSSADKVRWEVRVTIDGYQHAKYIEAINVRLAPVGFVAAHEMLDQPRLEALEFEVARPSGGAIEDAAGKSWHMRVSHLPLKIAGMALIGFASFWLWGTTSWFRGGGNAFDVQSAFAWGELLFHMPFVLVGLALEFLGLALLTLRGRFQFSAHQIKQELSALGFIKWQAVIRPQEVLGLRVVQTQTESDRLALAVVTKRGVMVLPIAVKHAETVLQPAKLRQHARWLATLIGRSDIAFDANPHRDAQLPSMLKLFGKSEPALAGSADDAVSGNTNRLKVFRAITGGMGILAFGGFALMFFGGVFGDHLGMKSKTGANVQRIPLEGCGYEDQNYCGTLIHMTRSNQAQHIRTLLAEGADPHERDGSGWSAWAYALSRGDSATIEAFLDAEVPARGKQDLPFNGTQRQNAPPLIFAIGQGNVDAIQTLIKRGADPAERGPYGYPAANFAAYYGNVAALKALKESGLDLLAVTPAGLPHDGETFLMHAAEGGKPEAVDYLLALGADPGQRDPRGKTAADHAKAYGHAALAEILWTRAKQ